MVFSCDMSIRERQVDREHFVVMLLVIGTKSEQVLGRQVSNQREE